ncbi:hypothetical protein LSTR_LSTR009186 [Laodelphax striatellus]|uniref:Spaetzle domain-containing protein n=1 Tax=Laodelphax striatellus TaxID=195883 RepID=A0A482XDG7_LAOST|nr:hypothetical protein LSTR_LSTR009186 [Laodelphax striatellus]
MILTTSKRLSPKLMDTVLPTLATAAASCCCCWLLLSVVSVSASYGYDGYTTCAKPYRSAKSRFDLPCDFRTRNWCTIPGTSYPWRAVRRFVFENHGLMRRMYGDERHISVLRSEIESNDVDYQSEPGWAYHDPALKNYQPPTKRRGDQASDLHYNHHHQHHHHRTPPPTTTTTSSPITTTSTTTTSTSTLATSPTSQEPIGTTGAEPPPASSSAAPDDVSDSGGMAADVADIADDDGVYVSTESDGGVDSTTTATSADDGATTTPNHSSASHELFTHELFDKKNAQTTEESPVYKLRGVNACPVKEEVVAPFWANNTRGEVLALLNLYPFEQYVHWERCTYENKQMFCRAGCRCEQQYRLHRLLAYDPSNDCRGIFSDWFKFPSCCVCRCYDLPSELRLTSRSPRSAHVQTDEAGDES